METTRITATHTSTHTSTNTSTPPITIITPKEYSQHNNNCESHSDDDDDSDDSETEYHDDEECETSGHCETCCELSKCTTKDEWARQGQYECGIGMYFPCAICEPQFNSEPQYINK